MSRTIRIQHDGKLYRVQLSTFGDIVEAYIPGSGPRVMRAEIPACWRTLKISGPTALRVVAAARKILER